MDSVTYAHPDVPREVQRWNWGAFLLNWIWGLGHRCYFGLLTFVPFFGLVVPFILGARGNAWAWRTGRWQTVAEFRRAQRRWTQAGWLAWCIASAGSVALYVAFGASLERTAAFRLAQTVLSSDPEVTQALEHLERLLDDGRRQVWTESPSNALPPPATPPVAPVAPVQEPTFPRLQPVTLVSRNTEVHGALPRKVIRTVLDGSLRDLAPCFGQSPVLSSKETLMLLIAPTGAVQTARLEDSTRDETTGTCVRRAAERLRFPPPDGGGLVVVRHKFTVRR